MIIMLNNQNEKELEQVRALLNKKEVTNGYKCK